MTAKIINFAEAKARLRPEKPQVWKSMDDLPEVDPTFDIKGVIGELIVGEDEIGY